MSELTIRTWSQSFRAYRPELSWQRLGLAGVLLAFLLVFSPVTFVYFVIVASSLFVFLAPLRWGLAGILLFTGVAGFLKELANYSTVAHVGNDIVLAALVVGHVLQAALGKRPLLPASIPFKLPILVLVLACLVLEFQPSTAIVQALGGWKAYVEPVILVPLVAIVARQRDGLRPMLWALVAAGLLNVVAALLEVRLGATVVQGWGPGFVNVVLGDTAFDQVGGAISNSYWRPFGLTAHAGHAGIIEALAAVVLLTEAASTTLSQRLRVVALTLAGLLGLGAVMSGVRADVITLVAGVALAMALARLRGGANVRGVWLLGVVVVAVPIAYVFAVSKLMQSRILGLFSPATYTSTRLPLVGDIGKVLTHSPLGLGMGRTVPAAELLSQLGSKPALHVPNENLVLGLVDELGYAGLAVVLLTLGVLMIATWRFLRARPDPLLDQVFLVTAMFVVVWLWSSIFTGAPTNVMIWMFSAALVAGVRIRQADLVEPQEDGWLRPAIDSTRLAVFVEGLLTVHALAWGTVGLSVALLLLGDHRGAVDLAVILVVAFVYRAPLAWGLAGVLAFSAVAGFLKELAGYAPEAHLANDIVLATLVVSHIQRWRTGKTPLFPDRLPFKVPIAVMLAASFVLSFSHATSPIQALAGWKAYDEPLLLIPLTVLAVQSRFGQRPLTWALVTGGVINAVASLIELRLGPKAVAGWGPGFQATVTGAVGIPDKAGNYLLWRPFGLTPHAGAAAVLEGCALVLLIYYALGPRPARLRLAALAAAAVCAVAVLFSGVRSAALMALVGLVLAALLSGRTRRNLSVDLAVGSAAVLLAVFVGRVSPIIGTRLTGLFDPATYATTRLGLFQYIFTDMRTATWGVGMGRTVPGSDIVSRLASRAPDAVANENMLLGLQLELGLAAILIVAWALAEMGVAATKYVRQSLDDDIDVALLVCVMLIVVGLAGSILTSEPTSLMFWVFGAALVCLVSRRKPAPVSLEPTVHPVDSGSAR